MRYVEEDAQASAPTAAPENPTESSRRRVSHALT